MLNKIFQYFKSARALARMNMALARAATTSATRQLHPNKPLSWEFCGFSQNGEDGIIDYLCSQIISPNRYFVEIGAADGLENNTSWLALAKKYSGLMIEGSTPLANRLQGTIPHYNLGVEILNQFVTKENVPEIMTHIAFNDPDVFSLDIDGNDYHIVKAFLENSLRPKIFAVEFNSAFGPDKAVTIPYQDDFDYVKACSSGLYYGVSISAWHQLFTKFGYQFVTVEANGVNAFYIDPQYFHQDWLYAIKGLPFAENFYQRKKFKGNWQKQFPLIEHLQLEVVS